MKNLSIFAAIILATLILSSCDVNDSYYNDYTPPSPPTGIQVLNGDNRVDVYWTANRESDVAGYNVYYNYTYEGKYTLIGSTQGTFFADVEAENGNKYFYAVAAYDFNGNESELSYDVIYSTPRPESFNQSLFDARRFPDNSGFTFYDYSVVPYNDPTAEFYFDIYEGIPYINVWKVPTPYYIQDLGATSDIYDIPYAPENGWGDDEYLRAYVGHTYVIWTPDDHFAKVRIKSMNADKIVFDWAFQLVRGEYQLKPVVKSLENRILKTKELAR